MTPCWKRSAWSRFFIKLQKSGTLYLFFFFCLDWTHAFTSHRITLKPQSCHETVTKGIEPTWSSPSRSVIVRKCCVCAPSMTFIVKRAGGLCWVIGVLPSSLIHDKARWAAWATLLYAVRMKSSGPKRALSLMIMIHVAFIGEMFLFIFLLLLSTLCFGLSQAVVYE